MVYDDIEKSLASKEGCEKLLAEYETKFLQISMIAEQLVAREIKSYDQIDGTLTELTGLYMQLHDVTETIDTFKTGEEGRLNFQYVKDHGAKGEKVVQAQIDKLVSHDVHFLRRVRNIFAANRDRADKGIGSCQSRLKKDKQGNYRESPQA